MIHFIVAPGSFPGLYEAFKNFYEKSAFMGKGGEEFLTVHTKFNILQTRGKEEKSRKSERRQAHLLWIVPNAIGDGL